MNHSLGASVTSPPHTSGTPDILIGVPMDGERMRKRDEPHGTFKNGMGETYISKTILEKALGIMLLDSQSIISSQI